MDGKKALIGMSGGVDSSVAAQARLIFQPRLNAAL